jgi:hypothetical protein
MTPDELRQAREAAYGQRFGTHLPLLAAVIAIAGPGSVLEVGTGHSSAPLISEMCKAMRRGWLVHDTDPMWRATIDDLGKSYVVEMADVGGCAVAFVDCVGWDRLKWLRHLRDRAEFIVVHDTDNPSGDLKEMTDYLDTFTHRYDYKVMTPWTTVVSMTRAYP